MPVEVFSDVVCHLGEGPGYHPETGRLWWFDILEKRLLEKRPDRSGTVVHDLPVNGSILAAVDADRQLLVGAGGLYVRDVASGRLALHRPLEADRPDMRSNDGRVHPSGALWLSTMSWEKEAGAGAIWWYRDGDLRKIIPGLGIPNAVCFAPDGSHGYYADTSLGKVWRIAIDPATGLPQGEPALYFQARDGDFWPDGAVVDADGLFWNARWGLGAVVCLDPDGREVRRIPVPATQSSCPAFLPDGRLAVTSAQEGMDAAARAADPLSGQTFVIEGEAFRSRFDPPVKLGEG